MKEVKEYVLGFAFNNKRDQVVLIQKERPDWQKGKLNGVGGKIEADESPIVAMMREFYEETGLQTSNIDWKCFAKMVFNNDILGGTAHVYCFKWFSDEMYQASTYTDEVVKILSLSRLSEFETTPNVEVLIQLALSKDFDYTEMNQFYNPIKH